MRENLTKLLSYKKLLFEYAPKSKMTMSDLKKAVNCADKTGQTSVHAQLNAELKKRATVTSI
jgi:hypothetical protein